MSKVLVDRELLERCVDRWACCAIVETPGAEQAWLELRAAAKGAQLRAEVEMMREDAERWRYVSLQGDDTHWLNLLRVDLEDFGGNINAAVDALIDGEAPAITAKEA